MNGFVEYDGSGTGISQLKLRYQFHGSVAHLVERYFDSEIKLLD